MKVGGSLQLGAFCFFFLCQGKAPMRSDLDRVEISLGLGFRMQAEVHRPLTDRLEGSGTGTGTNSPGRVMEGPKDGRFQVV